jgi:hypothetical protein
LTATRAGHGAVNVLSVEVRPDGDDDHELFLKGVVPEPRRCPVYEVTVRVGLTIPVERGEVAPEDAEAAAEILLGAGRPPWWKRWLASEAEKKRGMRWRVRG